MKTESFRTFIYSEPDKFENKSNRLSLKEYKDDLLFYVPFDANLDATFYPGTSSPVLTGVNELYNFGVFSQCVKTKGSIFYNANNFTELKEEGTIQFRIKPDFNNGYGSQYFNATSFTALSDGTYSFNLKVGNLEVKTISIDVSEDDTLTDIYNSMSIEVSPDTKAVVYMEDLKIHIRSLERGDPIVITGTENNSVVSLLSGVSTPIIANSPEFDNELFSLCFNNNNKIKITHKSTGYLNLKMYDQNGTNKIDTDMFIWSNNYLHFYAFDISWNTDYVYFFIDGQLLKVLPTGFSRSGTDGLKLSSQSEFYRFDELVVYNKQKSFKDYTQSTSPVRKYSSDIPFVDINFGNGFSSDEIKKIIIKGSDNLSFIMKLDGRMYYYLIDVWSFSDGSYSQSSDKNVLISKFKDLYFDKGTEVVFRVFFESSGITSSYIEEISLDIDENLEKPAEIIGSMIIDEPIDFSTGNDVFVIETKDGKKEVSVITHCIDPSNVTLQEIKEAINDASVPDLDIVEDDGQGHLVLRTISKGSASFLKVNKIV